MGRISPLTAGPISLLFITLVVCIAPITGAPVQESSVSRNVNGKGCYYLNKHHPSGQKIETNEPCLNCTCVESTLMCYLRVCPFVKPVGENCMSEMHVGDCCPKFWCPEVYPHSTTEKPETESRGCYLEGRYYDEGARIPMDPVKPCEVCYCIRNTSVCTMQECELKVDGCFPQYKAGSCCPSRYNCTDQAATTIPPGLMEPEDYEGCKVDGVRYKDGDLVLSKNNCESCYCMKHEVVCAVQECTAPGTNCVSTEIEEGQCCPTKYECPPTTEIPLWSTTYSSVSEDSMKNLSLTRSATRETTTTELSPIDISTELRPLFTEQEAEISSLHISTTQTIGRSTEASTDEGIVTRVTDGSSVTTEFSELITDTPSMENATLGASDLVSRSREPKITEIPDDMFTSTSLPKSTGKPVFYPSRPIPGEGICRHENKTYQSNEKIPSTDPCRINCMCLNSVVQCDMLECDFAPPQSGRNCKLKQVEPNECCRKYVCDPEDDETTSDKLTTQTETEKGVQETISDGLESTTIDFIKTSDLDDKKATTPGISTEYKQQEVSLEAEDFTESATKLSSEESTTIDIVKTSDLEDKKSTTPSISTEYKQQEISLAAEDITKSATKLSSEESTTIDIVKTSDLEDKKSTTPSISTEYKQQEISLAAEDITESATKLGSEESTSQTPSSIEIEEKANETISFESESTTVGTQKTSSHEFKTETTPDIATEHKQEEVSLKADEITEPTKQFSTEESTSKHPSSIATEDKTWETIASEFTTTGEIEKTTDLEIIKETTSGISTEHTEEDTASQEAEDITVSVTKLSSELSTTEKSSLVETKLDLETTRESGETTLPSQSTTETKETMFVSTTKTAITSEDTEIKSTTESAIALDLSTTTSHTSEVMSTMESKVTSLDLTHPTVKIIVPDERTKLTTVFETSTPESIFISTEQSKISSSEVTTEAFMSTDERGTESIFTIKIDSNTTDIGSSETITDGGKVEVEETKGTFTATTAADEIGVTPEISVSSKSTETEYEETTKEPISETAKTSSEQDEIDTSVPSLLELTSASTVFEKSETSVSGFTRISTVEEVTFTPLMETSAEISDKPESAVTHLEASEATDQTSTLQIETSTELSELQDEVGEDKHSSISVGISESIITTVQSAETKATGTTVSKITTETVAVKDESSTPEVDSDETKETSYFTDSDTLLIKTTLSKLETIGTEPTYISSTVHVPTELMSISEGISGEHLSTMEPKSSTLHFEATSHTPSTDYTLSTTEKLADGLTTLTLESETSSIGITEFDIKKEVSSQVTDVDKLTTLTLEAEETETKAPHQTISTAEEDARKITDISSLEPKLQTSSFMLETEVTDKITKQETAVTDSPAHSTETSSTSKAETSQIVEMDVTTKTSGTKFEFSTSEETELPKLSTVTPEEFTKMTSLPPASEEISEEEIVSKTSHFTSEIDTTTSLLEISTETTSSDALMEKEDTSTLKTTKEQEKKDASTPHPMEGETTVSIFADDFRKTAAPTSYVITTEKSTDISEGKEPDSPKTTKEKEELTTDFEAISEILKTHDKTDSPVATTVSVKEVTSEDIVTPDILKATTVDEEYSVVTVTDEIEKKEFEIASLNRTEVGTTEEVFVSEIIDATDESKVDVSSISTPHSDTTIVPSTASSITVNETSEDIKTKLTAVKSTTETSTTIFTHDDESVTSQATTLVDTTELTEDSKLESTATGTGVSEDKITKFTPSSISDKDSDQTDSTLQLSVTVSQLPEKLNTTDVAQSTLITTESIEKLETKIESMDKETTESTFTTSDDGKETKFTSIEEAVKTDSEFKSTTPEFKHTFDKTETVTSIPHIADAETSTVETYSTLSSKTSSKSSSVSETETLLTETTKATLTTLGDLKTTDDSISSTAIKSSEVTEGTEKSIETADLTTKLDLSTTAPTSTFKPVSESKETITTTKEIDTSTTIKTDIKEFETTKIDKTTQSTTLKSIVDLSTTLKTTDFSGELEESVTSKPRTTLISSTSPDVEASEVTTTYEKLSTSAEDKPTSIPFEDTFVTETDVVSDKSTPFTDSKSPETLKEDHTGEEVSTLISRKPEVTHPGTFTTAFDADITTISSTLKTISTLKEEIPTSFTEAPESEETKITSVDTIQPDLSTDSTTRISETTTRTSLASTETVTKSTDDMVVTESTVEPKQETLYSTTLISKTTPSDIVKTDTEAVTREQEVTILPKTTEEALVTVTEMEAEITSFQFTKSSETTEDTEKLSTHSIESDAITSVSDIPSHIITTSHVETTEKSVTKTTTEIVKLSTATDVTDISKIDDESTTAIFTTPPDKMTILGRTPTLSKETSKESPLSETDKTTETVNTTIDFTDQEYTVKTTELDKTSEIVTMTPDTSLPKIPTTTEFIELQSTTKSDITRISLETTEVITPKLTTLVSTSESDTTKSTTGLTLEADITSESTSFGISEDHESFDTLGTTIKDHIFITEKEMISEIVEDQSTEFRTSTTIPSTEVTDVRFSLLDDTVVQESTSEYPITKSSEELETIEVETAGTTEKEESEETEISLATQHTVETTKSKIETSSVGTSEQEETVTPVTKFTKTSMPLKTTESIFDDKASSETSTLFSTFDAETTESPLEDITKTTALETKEPSTEKVSTPAELIEDQTSESPFEDITQTKGFETKEPSIEKVSTPAEELIEDLASESPLEEITKTTALETKEPSTEKVSTPAEELIEDLTSESPLEDITKTKGFETKEPSTEKVETPAEVLIEDHTSKFPLQTKTTLETVSLEEESTTHKEIKSDTSEVPFAFEKPVTESSTIITTHFVTTAKDSTEKLESDEELTTTRKDTITSLTDEFAHTSEFPIIEDASTLTVSDDKKEDQTEIFLSTIHQTDTTVDAETLSPKIETVDSKLITDITTPESILLKQTTTHDLSRKKPEVTEIEITLPDVTQVTAEATKGKEVASEMAEWTTLPQINKTEVMTTKIYATTTKPEDIVITDLSKETVSSFTTDEITEGGTFDAAKTTPAEKLSTEISRDESDEESVSAKSTMISPTGFETSTLSVKTTSFEEKEESTVKILDAEMSTLKPAEKLSTKIFTDKTDEEVVSSKITMSSPTEFETSTLSVKTTSFEEKEHSTVKILDAEISTLKPEDESKATTLSETTPAPIVRLVTAFPTTEQSEVEETKDSVVSEEAILSNVTFAVDSMIVTFPTTSIPVITTQYDKDLIEKETVSGSTTLEPSSFTPEKTTQKQVTVSEVSTYDGQTESEEYLKHTQETISATTLSESIETATQERFTETRIDESTTTKIAPTKLATPDSSFASTEPHTDVTEHASKPFEITEEKDEPTVSTKIIAETISTAVPMTATDEFPTFLSKLTTVDKELSETTVRDTTLETLATSEKTEDVTTGKSTEEIMTKSTFTAEQETSPSTQEISTQTEVSPKEEISETSTTDAYTSKLTTLTPEESSVKEEETKQSDITAPEITITKADEESTSVIPTQFTQGEKTDESITEHSLESETITEALDETVKGKTTETLELDVSTRQKVLTSEQVTSTVSYETSKFSTVTDLPGILGKRLPETTQDSESSLSTEASMDEKKDLSTIEAVTKTSAERSSIEPQTSTDVPTSIPAHKSSISTIFDETTELHSTKAPAIIKDLTSAATDSTVITSVTIASDEKTDPPSSEKMDGFATTLAIEGEEISTAFATEKEEEKVSKEITDDSLKDEVTVTSSTRSVITKEPVSTITESTSSTATTTVEPITRTSTDTLREMKLTTYLETELKSTTQESSSLVTEEIATTSEEEIVKRDECVLNGTAYGDGESIQTIQICEKCHCASGEIICFKIICKIPMSGCIPETFSADECCPSSYKCPTDEDSTESLTVTALQSVTEKDLTTPIPISFMFSTLSTRVHSTILTTKSDDIPEEDEDFTTTYMKESISTEKESEGVSEALEGQTTEAPFESFSGASVTTSELKSEIPTVPSKTTASISTEHPTTESKSPTTHPSTVVSDLEDETIKTTTVILSDTTSEELKTDLTSPHADTVKVEGTERTTSVEKATTDGKSEETTETAVTTSERAEPSFYTLETKYTTFTSSGIDKITSPSEEEVTTDSTFDKYSTTGSSESMQPESQSPDIKSTTESEGKVATVIVSSESMEPVSQDLDIKSTTKSEENITITTALPSVTISDDIESSPQIFISTNTPETKEPEITSSDMEDIDKPTVITLLAETTSSELVTEDSSVGLNESTTSVEKATATMFPSKLPKLEDHITSTMKIDKESTRLSTTTETYETTPEEETSKHTSEESTASKFVGTESQSWVTFAETESGASFATSKHPESTKHDFTTSSPTLTTLILSSEDDVDITRNVTDEESSLKSSTFSTLLTTKLDFDYSDEEQSLLSTISAQGTKADDVKTTEITFIPETDKLVPEDLREKHFTASDIPSTKLVTLTTFADKEQTLRPLTSTYRTTTIVTEKSFIPTTSQEKTEGTLDIGLKSDDDLMIIEKSTQSPSTAPTTEFISLKEITTQEAETTESFEAVTETIESNQTIPSLSKERTTLYEDEKEITTEHATKINISDVTFESVDQLTSTTKIPHFVELKTTTLSDEIKSTDEVFKFVSTRFTDKPPTVTTLESELKEIKSTEAPVDSHTKTSRSPTDQQTTLFVTTEKLQEDFDETQSSEMFSTTVGVDATSKGIDVSATPSKLTPTFGESTFSMTTETSEVIDKEIMTTKRPSIKSLEEELVTVAPFENETTVSETEMQQEGLSTKLTSRPEIIAKSTEATEKDFTTKGILLLEIETETPQLNLSTGIADDEHFTVPTLTETPIKTVVTDATVSLIPETVRISTTLKPETEVTPVTASEEKITTERDAKTTTASSEKISLSTERTETETGMVDVKNLTVTTKEESSSIMPSIDISSQLPLAPETTTEPKTTVADAENFTEPALTQTTMKSVVTDETDSLIPETVMISTTLKSGTEVTPVTTSVEKITTERDEKPTTTSSEKISLSTERTESETELTDVKHLTVTTKAESSSIIPPTDSSSQIPLVPETTTEPKTTLLTDATRIEEMSSVGDSITDKLLDKTFDTTSKAYYAETTTERGGSQSSMLSTLEVRLAKSETSQTDSTQTIVTGTPSTATEAIPSSQTPFPITSTEIISDSLPTMNASFPEDKLDTDIVTTTSTPLTELKESLGTSVPSIASTELKELSSEEGETSESIGTQEASQTTEDGETTLSTAIPTKTHLSTVQEPSQEPSTYSSQTTEDGETTLSTAIPTKTHLSTIQEPSQEPSTYSSQTTEDGETTLSTAIPTKTHLSTVQEPSQEPSTYSSQTTEDGETTLSTAIPTKTHLSTVQEPSQKLSTEPAIDETVSDVTEAITTKDVESFTEKTISDSTTESPPKRVTDFLTKAYKAIETTPTPIETVPDNVTAGTVADFLLDEGACIFEGRIYQSAEQILREDPCEFCFCFRGDIICLQQSCPPPALNCHKTMISGYCCPRYDCPVLVTSLNMTNFSKRKGAVQPTFVQTAQKRIDKRAIRAPVEVKGCQINGTFYQVGSTVAKASGPCLHCLCEEGGNMRCDPLKCKPQPPLMLKMNNSFFRTR